MNTAAFLDSKLQDLLRQRHESRMRTMQMREKLQEAIAREREVEAFIREVQGWIQEVGDTLEVNATATTHEDLSHQVMTSAEASEPKGRELSRKALLRKALESLPEVFTSQELRQAVQVLQPNANWNSILAEVSYAKKRGELFPEGDVQGKYRRRVNHGQGLLVAG